MDEGSEASPATPLLDILQSLTHDTDILAAVQTALTSAPRIDVATRDARRATVTCTLGELLARPSSSARAAVLATAISRVADAGVETAIPHSGSFVSLAHALQTYGADPPVAVAVCRAVFILCRGSDNRNAALSSGILPLLLAFFSMPEATHPLDVLTADCDALANLLAHPEAQETAVRCGALPHIVSALRHYASDAPMAEAACSAILNIADCDELRSVVAGAGAIPAIVEALSLHPSAAGVAEAAWGALLNIADEPSLRTQILGAGALPLIMAALSAPSPSGSPPPALSSQCGLLESLAVSAAHRASCVGAGAVATLAAVLQSFKHDLSAARAVVGAIAALSDNGRGNGAPLESGCIPGLVDAALLHAAADVGLVARAAEAGWFLFRHIPNALASAQHFPALVGLLRGPVSSDARATLALCNMLTNAAVRNPDNKRALAEQGAAPVALSLLAVRPGGRRPVACPSPRLRSPPTLSRAQTHRRHAGVVDAACSLLHSMAFGGAARDAVITAGALDTLLMLLRVSPGGALALSRPCCMPSHLPPLAGRADCAARR